MNSGVRLDLYEDVEISVIFVWLYRAITSSMPEILKYTCYLLPLMFDRTCFPRVSVYESKVRQCDAYLLGLMHIQWN